MKKIYKVAEHIFTLVLTDGNVPAIEKMLKNYEPFDISESVSGVCPESLFTVSLEDCSNPYNVDHADEAISRGLLKAIYAGQRNPTSQDLTYTTMKAVNGSLKWRHGRRFQVVPA